MRFSTVAATAAIAGSAMAADHLVVVGNGTLTFEPNNLTAAEGDTVTFKYWPKSHSVAQATFAKPCEPMAGGFWSGYIPSEKGAAATTFQIEIKNASQPLWYYCSRATHCQDGMVGVINPPKTGKNTIEAFAEAAKKASNNTAPVSAQAVGGKLMNGTSGGSSMGGGSMNGTTNTGAASMLSASTGAVFTVAFGMVASLLV